MGLHREPAAGRHAQSVEPRANARRLQRRLERGRRRVAMVPFATASDGGGSIRTPASFTGLVGLKNTYGRIPTFGDTHLAQNSVVGSLTTSVRDTALLLDVMAGPDSRDRTSLPAPSQSYAGVDRHPRPHELSRRVVARLRLRRRRFRGSRRSAMTRPLRSRHRSTPPSSNGRSSSMTTSGPTSRSKASTSSSASTATSGRTTSTSSIRGPSGDGPRCANGRCRGPRASNSTDANSCTPWRRSSTTSTWS